MGKGGAGGFRPPAFTNTNTTMTKHYYKGLAANGITVANKRVPFIVLTNGDGIIQTDNPDIQAALDLRIEERRGGVRPITAAQYDQYVAAEDAAKKGVSAMPSPKPSGPRASVNPSLASLGGAAVAPSSRKVFRKAVPAAEPSPAPAAQPPAASPTHETGAP